MDYIDADKHIYGNFELYFLALTCVSSNDKVVYLYMRHQYHYFKSMRKEYFETIDTISEATGIARSTLKRSLSRLEEIGWLTKQTTYTKFGHRQTVYTVNNWRGETK